MSLFFRRYSIFFSLLMSIFLTACSGPLESDFTSISFSITKEMVNKILAVDASHENHQFDSSHKISSRTLNTEGLFIDVCLKGTYQDRKTIPLIEDTTVVFERVPFGSRVYAEATAYRLKNDEKQSRIIYFFGKTEPVNVVRWDTSLVLELERAGFLSVELSKENDLSLDCSMENGQVIFTANLPGSLSSDFVWFVDGIEKERGVNTFTFDSESYVTGTYEIEVLLGEKSAEAIIKVE